MHDELSVRRLTAASELLGLDASTNALFTLADLSATKSDRQIGPTCRPNKKLLSAT